MDAAPHDFLCKIAFFGGLDESAMRFLEGQMAEKKFPAGATVVQEGEAGRSMYIVRSGAVHIVRKGAAGHVVKLRLMHPGDFFGVTALVEMEPRPFSVVADSDSTLLELTCMDLHKLYKHDLKAYTLVVMNMNRELCRHLRSAASLLGQLMDQKPAEVREAQKQGPLFDQHERKLVVPADGESRQRH